MKAIEEFIDNLFFNYPESPQILKLKNELLINNEEKFNELVNSGLSENEAFGLVIEEFGSINDLANELGFENNQNKTATKTFIKKNLISTVTIVIWLIAICIYLITGILHHRWDNWQIFAVAGILYALFVVLYGVVD